LTEATTIEVVARMEGDIHAVESWIVAGAEPTKREARRPKGLRDIMIATILELEQQLREIKVDSVEEV
jgi:hypothetical protein